MRRVVARCRQRAMPPKDATRTTGEGGGAAADDDGEYPGVPGVPRAEVDAFLEDLDSFQPIVRALRCDAMRWVSPLSRSLALRVCSARTDARRVCVVFVVVEQIPDELTNHYLKSAGIAEPDTRVTRLISLATQRFVQQVADDAYRCAVQRNQAQIKEKKEKGYDTRDKRIVLENEDLAAALKDYGVNFHKPPYFVGAVPVDEIEDASTEDGAGDAAAKKRKARR